MRICIAATPSVALPTLDALLKSRHQIVSIITRPDAPAGRGREFKTSPVSDWAVANGVTLHKPITTDQIGLIVAQCDLVVTIGFGIILPEKLLQIPSFFSITSLARCCSSTKSSGGGGYQYGGNSLST